MTTKNAIETYEAILHEAALADAESRESTPREQRIAARVKARVTHDLAKLRRDLLPTPEPITRARPIRKWLYALGYDALIARIEATVAQLGGAVQYAHRDLSVLTEDDLRQLLDLLLPADATE
jgi:hypothetical protein